MDGLNVDGYLDRLPARPVAPGAAMRAVLDATFGVRRGGRLVRGGWLLWMGLNPYAHEAAPRRFADPVEPVFLLCGEVGYVRPVARPGGSSAVTVEEWGLPQRPRPPEHAGQRVLMRLETTRESTLYALYPRLNPLGAATYVTVVADRFDEAGMRVERAVAQRAMVQPLEVQLDWFSCDVDASHGQLRWWSEQPMSCPVQDCEPGWLVDFKRERDGTWTV
ncbi:hypothetical protein [Actinoplanes sp. URMC 104]|uniref:hypothetical protein n=1 Tax=Actinoplanes sp. URMC 104 TaxID=3423409 RepID=UPI003F19DB1F